MAGRQPNRRSKIYKGADGLYHCYVTVGTKPNGQLDRRHRQGETATEVARKVDELLAQVQRGRVAPGKIETVGEWLTHWLEHIIRPRRAYGTYTAYRSLINNYVIPNIGAWKLDGHNRRLEPEHLEAMYTKMAATKIVRGSRSKDKAPTLSDATIHKTHRMLNVAFTAAVRRGKTSRNVCKLVEPPTYRRKKVASLTVTETEAVIKTAMQDGMAARWLLGLLAGPRQGETLGIRWPGVHLDPPAGEEPYVELGTQLQRRTWEHGCADPVACAAPRCRTEPCRLTCSAHRARKGCTAACRPRCTRHTRACPKPCPPGCTGHARHCPQRHGGGLIEVALKTEKSARDIALPAVLVELLRQRRERQQQEFRILGLKWTPEVLVFTSPLGKPLDAGQDHKAWEELLRRAGVDDAKLHAARHTSATMLIASGVDISIVQDLLGHTQIATTRIYVDVAKKTQREALDRAVSALLDGNLAALLQRDGATERRSG